MWNCWTRANPAIDDQSGGKASAAATLTSWLTVDSTGAFARPRHMAAITMGGTSQNNPDMRPPRIIVPPDMHGLNHVVSRVVDRRMIFGEEEKARFRELLVTYAGLSGITVAAWCSMN